jgi:hypothetical protein
MHVSRLRVSSHCRMFVISCYSIEPGLNPVAGYPDGVLWFFSVFPGTCRYSITLEHDQFLVCISVPLIIHHS